MDRSFVAPRITGTEMEWSALCHMRERTWENGEVVFVDKMVELNENMLSMVTSPDCAPKGLETITQFRSNGSRFYKDFGAHIEYATPEDSSFMGTVANEIAGERITRAAFDNAATTHNGIKDFLLNKRVVDESAYGSSWGYHENYTVPAHRISINAESLALLGVHLATRNIFVGAGSLRRVSDKELRYFLAQKALNLRSDADRGTTSNKPVLNLRNEPHAGDGWRRVHVTSGDPNMSPWATFMKLGTTSLVLRLIENGITLDHLRAPENHLWEMGRHVAADLTLQGTVQLAGGKTIRPLEIQEQLIEAASKLAAEIPLPDEEMLVLSEWKKAHEDATTDPMRLVGRSDWATKKHILDHYAAKNKLGPNDPTLFEKDRQYDCSDKIGFGQKLRNGREWKKWMPPEELIVERMTTPPPDTRAHIRGTFVRAFADTKPDGASADWASVTLSTKKFELLNPYSFRHPTLEAIIKSKLASAEEAAQTAKTEAVA